MADDESRRDESDESGTSDEQAESTGSDKSKDNSKASDKDKTSGSRKSSSPAKSGSSKTKATKTASKTASKTRANAPADQRTGPVTFYRQVVAELRKVVWPTREQLVTYFFVVMAFVLVMIALVSLLDLGFGKLVFAVFGGAGDS